jgi:hypothetical protein
VHSGDDIGRLRALFERQPGVVLERQWLEHQFDHPFDVGNGVQRLRAEGLRIERPAEGLYVLSVAQLGPKT